MRFRLAMESRRLSETEEILVSSKKNLGNVPHVCFALSERELEGIVGKWHYGS